MNRLVSLLLRRNTSPSRIIGFVLSNFIGLTIVAGALQFYADSRSLWTSDDSFVSSDHMVVNKRVTAANTLGETDNTFSSEEIGELQAQPWVRRVGEFRRADFRVSASVGAPGSGSQLSTAMFFESVPDDFMDADVSDWRWTKESVEVPVVISRDYLALYNFGFSSAAGLPQLSESMVSGIPLQLRLMSEDGSRRMDMTGRVAGYSSRFNTILVPESFLEEMNSELGEERYAEKPSRLIVDVSSPGDTQIAPWLEEHGYEVAGDKTASSAAFLLRVTVGIVAGVGALITLLSLFILMLSISLLMERNRQKLHSLLMLGYPLRRVAEPYWHIVSVSSVGAGLLSFGAVAVARAWYIEPLAGLGARTSGLWVALLVISVMTILILLFNYVAVWRRVVSSLR